MTVVSGEQSTPPGGEDSHAAGVERRTRESLLPAGQSHQRPSVKERQLDTRERDTQTTDLWTQSGNDTITTITCEWLRQW